MPDEGAVFDLVICNETVNYWHRELHLELDGILGYISGNHILFYLFHTKTYNMNYIGGYFHSVLAVSVSLAKQKSSS